jgi:hypothetical protein
VKIAQNKIENIAWAKIEKLDRYILVDNKLAISN